MASMADVFTLANALLGFSAIIAGMEGRMELAYILVVCGVLADGLDGMVARRFGTKWKIGDFLDIMADTVTFAVAPSVLMWLTFRDGLGEPDLGLSVSAGRALVFANGLVIICAGVLRLARFCFESGNQESDLYFTGLPIPATALLVATMLLMGWPGLVVIVLSVISALLMVSDWRWPKARGTPSMVMGALGFLLVFTSLAGDVLATVSDFMKALTFAAVLMYQYLGPMTKGTRAEEIIEEYMET